MTGRMYKKIFNEIKKYDKIVLARHVGPDPDALGSTLGLKAIIEATFPDKKVYAVGNPASKFKYIGDVDKFTEDMYQDSLLIVTDTPDIARVDGVDPKKFKKSIKIDHHPFIEKFCDIEWIDDTASSASQMVMELTFNTKLVMTKEAAEKLYIGLVADTNRFLFYYTTAKTFDLVSKLIDETKIDFEKLYDNLYMRSFKEVKFGGYIADNLKVTDNGFAYLKITDDILEKYNVDAATAGNMVNNFNHIDKVYAWGIFSSDKQNNNIRGSVRSRGPIINEVISSNYNGGGHIYACGVRLKDFDEVDKLIKDLDLTCKEYIETSK
ncbi:MAG: bifunctional oligoribonuclease/PAP phosphatase NrnA [Bacilli bacterium]|nr:bifunctional oligoribonuclease/PAP phosphatase NrnA [Bacilli bacterium]